MDERSEPSPWERFLRAERRELELRREGLLARLLNTPLPNESPEELARLAEEDRLRAQAGLLELRMPSGAVLYKRLEELLPEDRAARANAERARIAWLKGRHEEHRKAGGGSRAARARFDEERARLLAGELSSAARAEERSKIGRELHDRVGHTMGVAHQSLQLYEALKERDPQGARDRLELAKRMVLEAMEQTRDLSQVLRRPPTGGEGLEASLSRLVGDIVPPTIERAIRVDGDEGLLTPEAHEQVFLIMREAVRNAVAHSQAGRISIGLFVREDRGLGIVEDDGVGFDRSEAERDGSGGLSFIQERAELVGGSCRARSAPGEGTRVEVSVPLA